MKKEIRLLFLFIGLFATGSLVYAEYKDRMKDRRSEIGAAKDAGHLGEGSDGLLHPRGEVTDEIQKLIDGENADRRLYFSDTAAKRSISENQVAEEFASAIKDRDKKGHWQKDASGSWKQK